MREYVDVVGGDTTEVVSEEARVLSSCVIEVFQQKVLDGLIKDDVLK